MNTDWVALILWKIMYYQESPNTFCERSDSKCLFGGHIDSVMTNLFCCYCVRITIDSMWVNDHCYVHKTVFTNVNQWIIVPSYLKEHDSFVNKEGQRQLCF